MLVDDHCRKSAAAAELVKFHFQNVEHLHADDLLLEFSPNSHTKRIRQGPSFLYRPAPAFCNQVH